jgi:glucosamine--fructose-6-phosphate aminotransferase (isomerizing)
MQESLNTQVGMAADFLSTSVDRALFLASSLELENESIQSIVITGSGDSHHAALGLEMAFRILCKRQVHIGPSMYVSRYLLPDYRPNCAETLVIAISSSGEVARTIEALEMGNEIGAHTLAITGNAESTLALSASHVLPVQLPVYPFGPGLLSYLGSLVLGFALAVRLSAVPAAESLVDVLETLPAVLERWMPDQLQLGKQFAHKVQEGAGVLIGGGPAYASALFGAAKVIEGVGEPVWAQDIEEWAHREYFCEPPKMTTWILSAEGRCRSRELEIIDAAHALGRNLAVSSFVGGEDWHPLLREIVSPLALWVAPTAYAVERSKILGSIPFRDFRGGRSVEEGGGASRIRSSERQDPGSALHHLDNSAR